MSELTSKDLVSKKAPSGMIRLNPRCTICNSSEEIMLYVNRQLVAGAGWTEIANTVATLVRQIGGRAINAEMVKRHFQNDFNFEHKALREIRNRRSTVLEEVSEEGVQRVLNAVTVAELMMNVGTQQMLEPGAVVTPGDTLAAAKLHRDITKDENDHMELAELTANFAKFIDAIQQVCTPEQMEQIVNLVETEEALELGYQEEFAPEEEFVTVVGED